MKLPRQLNLPLTFLEANQSENFIESDSNWEAITWIRRWPDWLSRQVVIYGESYSGKSHLGRLFAEKTRGLIVTPQLALDITPGDICQQATTFVIDDYDKFSDDTWLFHFYNIIQEQQSYVVYLGRKSPGQSDFALPDLQSRLRSLLALPIFPPCDNLQRRLLRHLLQLKGLEISEDVMDYLLHRIERSYVAISQVVDKIDTLTLSLKRPLTLPLVRDLLHNL